MNDIRPMIEVRGARKFFGPLEVLKGIDFSVARGQIVAVIGPSGSGKSTLLRSINGLETFDDGLIEIDGARHELFQEADRYRAQAMAAIDAFIPGSDAEDTGLGA